MDTLSRAETHEEDDVHFCLLAEFDIDTGATLAHQYPYPTGTDEHRLAELMLPDGAHHRAEDWTIFYLGQCATNAIAPVLQHEHNGVSSGTEGSHQDEAEISQSQVTALSVQGKKGANNGAGLLYVLNCVRMKEDKSMRRGAMVKALAICTPHPYIGIYKPLLLLALEEYFTDPSPAVLGRLYDAANAIPTSGMPSLTRHQRIILRTSERKDLFEQEFGVLQDEREDLLSDGDDENSLSRVKSQSDERASIDTSIADHHTGGSRPSFNRQGSMSSSGHSPQQSFTGHDPFGIGQQPEPHIHLSAHRPRPPRSRGRPKDTHFFDTSAIYQMISVPIRIPLTSFDEDVGDYSIIQLVQTFSSAQPQAFPPPYYPELHSNGAFTHPVILILNAMLANKRVLFLGHGLPANSVARMVLSACAVASGSGQVIRGVTEIAFPYANLASLDILEEYPGYVAGVTNPRFEELPGRWDVLCNLENGKVTVSKEFRETSTPPLGLKVPDEEGRDLADAHAADDEQSSGLPLRSDLSSSRIESSDHAFMDEIIAAINAHFGESTIRMRFADYLARFVRVAARYEQDTVGSTELDFHSQAFRPPDHLGSGAVFADDSSRRKEVQLLKARIDAWRQTRGCQYFKEDFHSRSTTAPIQGFDLQHQLSRLRSSIPMSTSEAIAIYTKLASSITTEPAVTELLAHLPHHLGGLAPVAAGLFHSLPVVREATVRLFDNIHQYQIGQSLSSNLNAFQRIAYLRLRAELDNKDIAAT